MTTAYLDLAAADFTLWNHAARRRGSRGAARGARSRPALPGQSLLLRAMAAHWSFHVRRGRGTLPLQAAFSNLTFTGSTGRPEARPEGGGKHD
jgi:hypothetical protein